MKTLLKIFRILLLGAVCCVSLLVIGVVSLYYYFSKDLPKLDSLKDYNPPVVSEVFSADGTKIGEFWIEKRYLLSVEEFPSTVIQATIASEDDRFYEHKGIDLKGIIRATLQNLKAGHVVAGGSTITQQVTKSLLLTPERKFGRKVKEAILSVRIEKKFSKDEILYLYLNQIDFGNRSYGIEAAAQNYFHKTAKELNIAEAAFIIGLAKGPGHYNPWKNPKGAKERQYYVIEQMLEENFITKDQAKKAREYPLKIYKAKTDKEFNYQYAPWFTEHIRRYLQQTYGEQVPYTHGLKIYTTLDLSMQKAADKAVLRGLRELDQRQGYSGPIKKLSSEEINEFNQSNHLIIFNEAKDDLFDPFKPLTKEEVAQMATPLEPAKTYQAVITSLDSSGQNLELQVGNQKGIIRVHDYKWARKRNTNSTGYNDVYYIKNPQGTFFGGDVIIVALKEPTETEYQTKGYQKGKTYFSLEQNIEVEGALFSFEISTGFVRAIVGGKDFKQSEFNRAMQALRQTGSVFKPLLYAAALDKGYSTSTVIEDSPVYYEYSPGRFWSPQNYGGGYKGPTTFRGALVNSRNVVSVKILMDIGIDYVTGYARKLGITSPIQRYFSMALGANDMKLFEVSRAFGTFPNGGILPKLVYIKKMTDRYGRVLEEYEQTKVLSFKEQIQGKKTSLESHEDFNLQLFEEGKKWADEDKVNLTDIEKRILYGNYIPEGYAISPRTAYTMVQLMNDIVNYGTGYKVKELKKPAAGKTGTTNDETDTWFIGYTPDLFAGVWVGFDEVKKLGGRETGGKTAAPIFLYYMQEALKNKPVAQFEIPKEINEASLDAPIDITAGDAEAGGITGPGGGVDFFIYDF